MAAASTPVAAWRGPRPAAAASNTPSKEDRRRDYDDEVTHRRGAMHAAGVVQGTFDAVLRTELPVGTAKVLREFDPRAANSHELHLPLDCGRVSACY